ncbi:peptide MFS transporter [Rhodococcus wratislaviensis]|uniref:peptide MFS transporter n=1 Tax=Rhodococcus wratislaviensis TaxID=44752 RepID=UPI0035166B70
MTAELNHRAEADNLITGRPTGLWSLSLTEVWERFSFYGLQSILTFYLLYSVADGGLALEPATAVGIVGAYGGCVYLAQLPGAWLADRVFSPRTMVVIGGTVIMLGHIALAFVPGIAGLIAGLTMVSLGTGGLKTSITATVGILYNNRTQEDRDAGFSYFYMALAIGSVAGMVCVGFTQSRWGFHVAFGLAILGMAAALAQYVTTMRSLPAESGIVKNPIGRAHLGYLIVGVALTCVIVVIAAVSGLVRGSNINFVIGAVIVVVFIASITRILRSADATPAEKRRVRGYVPMWIAASVFFGLSGQIFTTVPLLITERVNLDVGGWHVPEAWLSVVGAVALIVAAPLMASVFKSSRLGLARTTTKYVIGISVTSIAFFMLILTELWPGRTVSPFFVAACLIVAGVSEVLVGPIGLSLATRIAPQRFASQMVALQILTLGAGATIYGALGELFTKIPTGYFFCLVGVLGVVAAAVLAGFSRRIERLIEI